MFKILKFIIWVVGTITVAYFVMRHFGYDFNFGYFSSQQAACHEQVRRCQEEFLAKGYENPECKIKNCVQDTIENSGQFIIKPKK